MIDSKKSLVMLIFVLSHLLTSCSTALTLSPTMTPTSTDTPISTSTNTPIPTVTFTPTPEMTATETPIPTCHLGDVVEDTIDDEIPGHLDIVKISTNLEGELFTAVFYLRELPDQITINQKNLPSGSPEIVWGVAIDTDNNPNTGEKSFLLRSGYGFDTYLLTFHFKNSEVESTGSIDKLLNGKSNIWNKTEKGFSSGPSGTLSVDPQAKTLTMEVEIPNITSDSVLYFYTYFIDAENSDMPTTISDELCNR